MQYSQKSPLSITTIFLLLFIVFVLFLSPIFIINVSILNSLQQLNTIFLSILIEAIPFVLISVLIAGFIQIFITEEHIRAWIPKSKVKAVLMGCIIGSLFPACECGIVPIVRRLIDKGVPLHAGVGFLLTGPLINPIVIFSTYIAFGNDMKMALLRMGVGFIASLAIALVTSILFKSNQLKTKQRSISQTKTNELPIIHRVKGMIEHSIDEFFDMSKYLIIGAFVAAALQTFVSARSLLLFGDSVYHSTIVMMALAFFLSLCSEADAFIGSSFSNLFPTTSILAFLIYGPMIDLKNMIMLLSAFKAKFVFILFMLITIIVFTFVSYTGLILGG